MSKQILEKHNGNVPKTFEELEKLPTAMVEIAKFIGKFKSGVNDAKQTLDNELNLSDMKSELESLKAQLAQTKEDAKKSAGLDDLNLDEVIHGDYALESKKDKPKAKLNDEIIETTITQNDEEKTEKKSKKEDNL